MKKILFINGCVRGEHSRTLRIANTYINKIKGNPAVEIIERDLTNGGIAYKTRNSFDPNNGELLPVANDLAKEFADADEIILAAPFWEFMFPSIVNCYFENIAIVGTTFNYTDKGSVGLCKAKTFKYIYTAGDCLKQEDKINEKYLIKLTKLFGIPLFSSIVVDGLDIITKDSEKLVSDMCDKIVKKI